MTKRPDLEIVNKQAKIVDCAVQVEYRVKLKEGKNRDEYQDLAWELKHLWNMKVIVIPIVNGALGLIQELEDLEKGHE